ncbi:hypothetical protein GGX14DRAFT_540341 [Mycena pura]|uniref:Uncharacterized protein n=1 Tax=Mycena pura TaxID=153505 RepID=A0AAD6VVU8_9AGAR|nr:hypothetical protein GGX14DRAFT_540341 [Mycena pura]
MNSKGSSSQWVPLGSSETPPSAVTQAEQHASMWEMDSALTRTTHLVIHEVQSHACILNFKGAILACHGSHDRDPDQWAHLLAPAPSRRRRSQAQARAPATAVDWSSSLCPASYTMVLFMSLAPLPLLVLLASGSPSPRPARDVVLLSRDSEPQFPSSPSTCGVCQQNYDAIKLCLSVVPVMANFTSVITNPGSFTDTITCACSDPFHSTFAPCIDCFEQTNQTSFLNMPDPVAVVNGLNKVCALEGAVFGIGVSSSIVAPASATQASDNNSNGAIASRPFSSSSLLLGAAVLLLGSACW